MLDKVVDVEVHVKFKNKCPCFAKKREKLRFSCITLFLFKYLLWVSSNSPPSRDLTGSHKKPLLFTLQDLETS